MRPPSTIFSAHQQGAHSQRLCLAVFIGWMVAIGVVAWTVSPAKPEGRDGIGYIAALVAVVVAPALCVLFGIDLLPYLNWRTKRGASNLFWRGLILVGCWYCALALLLIVVLAVAMGMDSDWSHLDGETLFSAILGPVLCLIFLRLAWGLFKMPFSRASPSSEAAEEKGLAEHEHLDGAS